MSILKQSLILIPALMLLSACGGGDECTTTDGRPLDSTTDTSATCANTRGAFALSISYPSIDAINQLDGGGAGIYSYKGSILVTDQNGNAVADDTIVQLDVFDTLIVRGTILAGDTISGSIITDNAGIVQGDDTTATTINTAVVTRNLDISRGVQVGDLVLLINAATSDRIRYVASTTANSITVNAPYNNTYPSALYPAAQYLVGQALIPASVLGTDPDDETIKTRGVSKTRNGVAAFRLEYPNNRLGYGNTFSYTGDTRELPFGSASVWVVANVGGSVATASPISFPGIAPGQILISPAVIAGSQLVTITVLDANNNSMAFTAVGAGSGTGGSGPGCVTDEDGQCDSFVTVSATAGPITYSIGTATGEVTFAP